jgi:hypothetical protein
MRKIIKKFSWIGLIILSIVFIILLLYVGLIKGADIAGVAAIIALGFNFYANERSIKARTVSGSRKEWLLRAKKLVAELINLCNDFFCVHEEELYEIEKIINLPENNSLKHDRDMYYIKVRKIRKHIIDVKRRLRRERIEEYPNAMKFPGDTKLGIRSDSQLYRLSSISNDTLHYDAKKHLDEFWIEYWAQKKILTMPYSDKKKDLAFSMVRAKNKEKLVSVMGCNGDIGEVRRAIEEKKKDIMRNIDRLFLELKFELSDNEENNELIYMIKLLKEHVYKIDRAIWISAVDKYQMKLEKTQFDCYQSLLVKCSREYFKREWEKVKNGE